MMIDKSSSGNIHLPPRPDGRSDSTLRPLTCELACLENCDGSALWKSGGTHVVASVHGPIAPSQPHHEIYNQCRIQVLLKQQQSTSTSELEAFLAQILYACCLTKKYPRTVVQLTILVESADGSILAAALHASIAAFMDAGIEMKMLPAAVTCLMPRTTTLETRSIRMDPTREEENLHEAATVVLVLCGNDPDQIIGCHTPCADVQLGIPSLLQCSSVAARATQAIHAFLRLSIESRVKREAQTLWSS